MMIVYLRIVYTDVDCAVNEASVHRRSLHSDQATWQL